MSYQVDAVSFSWRMPDNTRTSAVFAAHTQGYDEARDRIIVQLAEMQTPLDAQLDDATQALIQGLTGTWVQIPSEARLGMTLPLKYETLTRQVRYFHDQDPRTLPPRNRATQDSSGAWSVPPTKDNPA
jgi:hypothetical protein